MADGEGRIKKLNLSPDYVSAAFFTFFFDFITILKMNNQFLLEVQSVNR